MLERRWDILSMGDVSNAICLSYIAPFPGSDAPFVIFTCINCMFETIRSQESISDKWYNYMNGRHRPGAGSIFRMGYVCLRNMPFWGGPHYHDIPLWIEEFLYQQFHVSHVWNPCFKQSEPGKVFQISNIIYINGTYVIMGGGIFRTGDVWECNVPFWGCPLLTMYLYELLSYLFPNSCLACFKRMLKTVISWESIPDIKYNLLQWKICT